MGSKPVQVSLVPIKKAGQMTGLFTFIEQFD